MSDPEIPPATPTTALVPTVPGDRSERPVPVPRGRRLSQPARTAVDASLKTLEVALGGRAKMVDALALGATGSLARDRAEYILGLLADPKHAHRSLRKLAAHAGITLDELLTLYRDSTVMRAHLRATSIAAQELPGVVAHVFAHAVPYELACGACGGLGKRTPDPTRREPNPSPQPCESCGGAGRVIYQPDLERQKLALQLGGLLKGGGAGTVVNVTQQQATQPLVPLATGDTLVLLQRQSDRALYGAGGPRHPGGPGPTVTDARVADAPDPDDDDPDAEDGR